jgi:hypothetical protein
MMAWYLGIQQKYLIDGNVCLDRITEFFLEYLYTARKMAESCLDSLYHLW